jgi:hypothetical protein
LDIFHSLKKLLTKLEIEQLINLIYQTDDLPYFRTLHSLAFRRLGIKKENVMQRRHYADLGKKINMRIDYNEYDEEQTGIFTTHSDYLRVIQLARVKRNYAGTAI